MPAGYLSVAVHECTAFIAAVETAIIVRQSRRKDRLIQPSRAPAGETEQEIIEEAADLLLRWVRLQLNSGRRFDPPTPIAWRRRGMVKVTPR